VTSLDKLLPAEYLKSVRAADCDTPGCTDRMEGADDEDLLCAIRKHVDSAHPRDLYTDEQLRDWMRTTAYTIAEPQT